MSETDQKGQLVRKLREISPMLRKCLFLLLFLSALVCAVAGSLDWCRNTLGQTGWVLASSTFMSTLDLFVFSPNISIGEMDHAPVAYLIAMWLAPVFTATAILQLVRTKLRRAKVLLLAEMRRHILIFGYNENSRALIDDLLDHDHLFQPERIMLICEDPLPEENRLELERLGVAVLTLPLINSSGRIRNIHLRLIRLEKATAVALMYEDPLDNYAVFCHLDDHAGKWAGDRRSIPCAFLSESPSVIHMAIAHQEKSTGGHTLDVKSFCAADVAAKELFCLSGSGLRVQGHPLWENARMEAAWDVDKLRTLHLLLVGTGSYVERILTQALKLGTTATQTPMHITILDRQAGAAADKLRARIRDLDKLCTLHTIESDVHSTAWQEALRASQHPVTYGAICLSDATAGLWVAQELFQQELISSDAPVGVLIHDKPVPLDALGQYGRIFPFGRKKDIFTRENMFLESLDRKAQQFFNGYTAMWEELLNGGTRAGTAPPDWRALSYIKKESARAQAEYYDLIRLLCGRLDGPPDVDAVMGDVISAGSFDRLRPEHKYVVKLAALEHARWCRFYYLNGYRFGPQKDEVRKTHNCLIDDWFDLLDEARHPGARDTMKYDFVPVLMALAQA